MVNEEGGRGGGVAGGCSYVFLGYSETENNMVPLARLQVNSICREVI